MATIFRGKVVTAVAVLSTTVAINAQTGGSRLGLIGAETQPRHLSDFPTPAKPLPVPYIHDVRNRHVFLVPPNPQPTFVQSDWPTPNAPIRSLIADAILNPTLFLLRPVGQPFSQDDWPSAPQVPLRLVVHHHRQQVVPSVTPPSLQGDWPRPTALPLRVIDDPIRNRILLPLPPVGVPFTQKEWANPSSAKKEAESFLFYYIQDQTKPGFINYDWPKAPKLPSLIADPIPNRILFPFIAPPPPFRQQDWPNASTRQIAKIVDPYNRNVFLPVPQGQPGHQHDWPLPQGARALQGSHTVDDLGILSQPVPQPVRPIEWPTPRAVLLTVTWEREGFSLIYYPHFHAEWAENSNQIVGPWAPQPETH